jgi:imidazolonepropionase-like amidohydrolase
MVAARAQAAEPAPLAIVNATVHTGAGAVIEKATVVVAGERIVAVGAAAVPAGARIVDAAGRVVTPGFIAIDTAVGLAEIWGVEETVDGAPEGDPIRAGLRAADAYNPRSTVQPVTLTGGVTTALAAPWGGLVAGTALVADLVTGAALDEVAPVFQPAAAMVVNLGVPGRAAAGGSRAGALLRLAELLDDARLFKSRGTAYLENRLRTLPAGRLDLEAMLPVLDRRIPLLVRVERAADIEAVVALARTQDVRVVISGGTEAWMVAPLLAAAGVPVAVDPLANLPDGCDLLGARPDNAARLHAAGVRVILASDVGATTTGTHNLRDLRVRAGNAVRAGLPPAAALEALTANPARAFGLDAERGTLAPGKIANVVLWSGDPFEIGTVADVVVVRGRVADLTTRQGRLARRYLRLHGLLDGARP